MYRKVINPCRDLSRPRRISRRAIPLARNRRLDQREHCPVTSAGDGDCVVGAAAEELASCWKIEFCDGTGMMGEASELFVVRVLEDASAGEGREGRCRW